MKKLLFNPGPTNVSEKVRESIKTEDICHREKEFFEVLLRLNNNLVKVLNGEKTHSAIVFVSSGTGCNEAICSSIHGKVLVLNNGKYSDRICEILKSYNVPFNNLILPSLEKMNLEIIKKVLEEDKEITHLYMVHHETTTGVLAPLREIGQLAKKYNKLLCVDGVSSIGCHEFDLEKDNIAFCAVSANKGLESFPGVSLVIAKNTELEKLEGKSRSFYFDIYKQWKKGLKGETPFTPAVQLIFSLDAAIQELVKEGYSNRVFRYKKLAEKMRQGLKNLGFELILPPEEIRSNILTAVKMPEKMDYWKVHDKLKDRGITIYSDSNVLSQGKFRVATLGNIEEVDIEYFLKNLREVCEEEQIFENKKSTKAIILAGGKGTRLMPLTENIPKSFVEVNGKSILLNMLEILESQGIEEVIISTGHMADKIKSKLGQKFNNIKISYVDGEQSGTAKALLNPLEKIELPDQILILEGDVFLEKILLEEFLKISPENATIVQKYLPHLDGSFVSVENDIITSWIHKNFRPKDYTVEDKFKTVNIHKFNREFVKNFLIPTLKKCLENNSLNLTLEYIMNEIVNHGGKITSFEVGNKKWFEIDDINDLKIAEEIFKKKLTLDEIKNFHGGCWREDIIDFHYLVNCFFPPKNFFDSMAKNLHERIKHYPSNEMLISEFVSKWEDKGYIHPEDIIVTNGLSEAIKVLNQIIKKVLLPIPTFNEYTKLHPEKISFFLLDEKNNFRINAEEIIAKNKETKCDFIVICNPNNPSGMITPREEIVKILNTGINVIVDEAFIDFCKENSISDLILKYNNLIILKTLTKSMGVAGLRIGYILTKNQDIKEKIRNFLPLWNINFLSEYFLEKLPEYREDYNESIRKTNEETERVFQELQNLPFLEPYKTKSNFIFCKTKVSSKKIAEFLLEKYRILIRYQLNQETLKSDNYIRIGIRDKQDNDLLIKALKEFEFIKDK